MTEPETMTALSNPAEALLLQHGCEGYTYLTDYDYASAIIGVTFDGRVIYDHEKMVEWLLVNTDISSYDEAVEWIDYNTLRALPYAGDRAPLIVQQV